MPGLNGMELSRMLPSETRVIFTTAFSQYAVEGFRVRAIAVSYTHLDVYKRQRLECPTSSLQSVPLLGVATRVGHFWDTILSGNGFSMSCDVWEKA